MYPVVTRFPFLFNIDLPSQEKMEANGVGSIYISPRVNQVS